MFERRHQPLLPRNIFLRRVGRFAFAAFVLIIVSWLVGILGYRLLEGMAWIDAMLNAAMILGGMGPVDDLHTDAGKIFASFYALCSGIIILVAVGVLSAPVLHRLLHRFHLEADKRDEDDDDDSESASS